MTIARDACSTVISTLIEAMPEPVLVVSDSVRLVAANAPARALFPLLRLAGPLASSVRAVDLHDAVARVLASGVAEDVSWLARAPVERLYDAHVAAFGAGETRLCRGHPARRDGVAAAGTDARGFRRQRQP